MSKDDFARALSDRAVKNARPKDAPYKLADGGGLHLLVQPNGSRLWRYKFRLGGKEQVFAIGRYPDVGLAEARERHLAARRLVADGVSPTAQRRDDRARMAEDAARAKAGTFKAVLDSWKATPARALAPATIRQRDREIDRYLEPKLGARPVGEITRRELADLLKTVATDTPEVARNLRTHMNSIFEHAVDVGLIAGNPTPGPRALPARKQTSHPAVAMDELGALLASIDASACQPATKAAFRLLLLTACRKLEITSGRWDEIDLDAGEWLIPADRMKTRTAHWVPLSRQAVELLRAVRAHSGGDYVFPHRDKPNTPMSPTALNEMLRRVGYRREMTVHGTRSIFSTWANAQPGANVDVIERCLAHAPRDKVRAAYNRHAYKDERRALLQSWADVLDAAEFVA
ncbi:tyrosine-type recombinase/integrase [Bordetella petrii]|uniref:Int3 protein n=1 Tax=Bordetella petrii (strain ATCC BAA-461 / DSM 12804 / CCUG 43448 / CIP 107267 / Se-1111R) TaxID=340100 RepID=A9IRV8_BORPD|nr:integrase arm-type DNA-binding domain-containing protein [Bordetella petrii]CAP43223.1 int3 [Bordetella petrii]